MSDSCSEQSPHFEHEYMTVLQVAELLQVKGPTVYGWVRDDPSLPALKIGHTVRFRRAALMAWLRSREQGRPTMRRRVLAVAARVESGGTGAP